jgi:hypothetical protein
MEERSPGTRRRLVTLGPSQGTAVVVRRGLRAPFARQEPCSVTSRVARVPPAGRHTTRLELLSCSDHAVVHSCSDGRGEHAESQAVEPRPFQFPGSQSRPSATPALTRVVDGRRPN